MEARLIVNPNAGTEEGSTHIAELHKKLRSRFSKVDVTITENSGDAAKSAHDAVLQGYSHLLIAGGDGTLNEAINGAASVPGGHDITLGVLPLGTGNDFCKALGFSGNAFETIDMLFSPEATVQQIDLGELNGRYFINASAGGFIAEVSDSVSSKLKSITGRLAYLIGGAQALLDHRPAVSRIEYEDQDRKLHCHEISIQFFAVSNAPLIGAGHPIAPHAKWDDGRLDLCIVREMGTLEFLRLLSTIPKGGHIQDERVIYDRTTQIRMQFAETIKVNTDGEVLETKSCEYRIHPRRLKFIVAPQEPSSAAQR
jgi:diacylglycerol kinase (ATP)